MAVEHTEAFVAIGSENFETLVAFYAALLGREPDERIGATYAAFRLPGLHLGIFRPKAAHAAEFRNPPDRHGGLSLVLRVAEIEGAAVELARLGAPPPGPILERSHGRELHAYDPDGNRLVLVG